MVLWKFFVVVVTIDPNWRLPSNLFGLIIQQVVLSVTWIAVTMIFCLAFSKIILVLMPNFIRIFRYWDIDSGLPLVIGLQSNETRQSKA